MDYLFTNWPGKKDESGPEIQTIVLDLYDKIKSIEGDDRIDRLKNKPMDKWNKADILLAKVKSVKKIESKNLDFKQYRTESILKSSNQCLMEMKILDGIYKMLMTVGSPDTSKPESKATIHSQIEDIVEKIIKPSKGVISNKKKYDSDGIIGIDCSVRLHGEKYAIHTYYSTSSKKFYMALWDEKEIDLLIMLTEGYLREKYYLVGVGKMRLRSFLGDSDGK